MRPMSTYVAEQSFLGKKGVPLMDCIVIDVLEEGGLERKSLSVMNLSLSSASAFST